jgi:DNA-binding NarL/FixJ family response regulator
MEMSLTFALEQALAAHGGDVRVTRTGASVNPNGREPTRQESRLLELLESGMPYKQIAREMNIAPSTAKNHARSLFAKLGVHSRAAAVYEARRRGAIDFQIARTGRHDRNGCGDLTVQESRLLLLLSSDMCYKRIAREMNITESTAKSHAHNIFKKQGVHSRDAAVTEARRRRLL